MLRKLISDVNLTNLGLLAPGPFRRSDVLPPPPPPPHSFPPCSLPHVPFLPVEVNGSCHFSTCIGSFKITDALTAEVEYIPSIRRRVLEVVFEGHVYVKSKNLVDGSVSNECEYRRSGEFKAQIVVKDDQALIKKFERSRGPYVPSNGRQNFQISSSDRIECRAFGSTKCQWSTGRPRVFSASVIAFQTVPT